ncbi:transposable element Tc1 transposase [Trichonephila clavipes]|nr:transposable element Tc1 transposase [Trichonephila clavipes]
MLHSQLYGNISGKAHFSSSRITTLSRLAKTQFDEMGVQKLDWPSQSPDLNPIEHLWGELEHRLRSQSNRLSSLQALTSAVRDAWKAIPMVTYQKLVESLPKRV